MLPLLSVLSLFAVAPPAPPVRACSPDIVCATSVALERRASTMILAADDEVVVDVGSLGVDNTLESSIRGAFQTAMARQAKVGVCWTACEPKATGIVMFRPTVTRHEGVNWWITVETWTVKAEDPNQAAGTAPLPVATMSAGASYQIVNSGGSWKIKVRDGGR